MRRQLLAQAAKRRHLGGRIVLELPHRQLQTVDLRLLPNDHLVEIGTGWGGLAIHAAQHYGCRVTTTTISREQHDFAKEKIDLQIDTGDGSANTVTKVMAGSYQAGFGDINAIIQNAATRPAGTVPVMVYMVYNRAPFAIMVKAGSLMKVACGAITIEAGQGIEEGEFCAESIVCSRNYLGE